MQCCRVVACSCVVSINYLINRSTSLSILLLTLMVFVEVHPHLRTAVGSGSRLLDSLPYTVIPNPQIPNPSRLPWDLPTNPESKIAL